MENPPKYYAIRNVQKNYRSILWKGTASGNGVPPDGGAAFIPITKARGLTPRFGKIFPVGAPCLEVGEPAGQGQVPCQSALMCRAMKP
jgi:hypothetical protein